MIERTALVAGATGLVGGFLVRKLLASPAYGRVVVLVRASSGLVHPKLHEIVVNFDRLESSVAASGEKVDDAFCALGTTIKRAGSQEAFRRVDFDYVVAFAKAAEAAGARQFLLVTAIGSSAKSGIFYSRVKGEAENAVAALGFAATHIFRPGMLLGRRGESRPGEAVAQALTPFVNPLLLGPAAAYRGIDAQTVAASMAEAALRPATGLHVHTYRSMMALAAG
jgi:uncharacterized protein YbjT (DUF2867 family)